MNKTCILVQDSSCFLMLFPSAISRVHDFSHWQDMCGHGLNIYLIFNLIASTDILNNSAYIKTKLCQTIVISDGFWVSCTDLILLSKSPAFFELAAVLLWILGFYKIPNKNIVILVRKEKTKNNWNIFFVYIFLKKLSLLEHGQYGHDY